MTRTFDMKRPASLGLGVVLGLAGGWLAAALMRGPNVAPRPAPSTAAQRPAETSPETPPPRSATVSEPAITPPSTLTTGAPTPPVSAAAPLRPSPLAAVAPRFAEPELRARFIEAFEEVETEGRIARVDCAELPCIVFGELPEADDLDNLVSSDAFSAYGRDGLVQHQSEEAEDRFLFAVALFEPPTDARERARVEARLQARIRMGGSFRGR